MVVQFSPRIQPKRQKKKFIRQKSRQDIVVITTVNIFFVKRIVRRIAWLVVSLRPKCKIHSKAKDEGGLYHKSSFKEAYSIRISCGIYDYHHLCVVVVVVAKHYDDMYFLYFSGHLDSPPWRSHLDGGRIHLHNRSKVSGPPQSKYRWMDPGHQIRTRARCWHLWVPNSIQDTQILPH